MTTHPVAVVVERRSVIGDVCIVEVRCPFARHRHTVGVTDRTTMWCAYGVGRYTVTLQRETSS